ncbi:MAG: serine hydrolase [Variovorax sp.]
MSVAVPVRLLKLAASTAWRRVAAGVLACGLGCASAADPNAWSARLTAELSTIDAQHRGGVGVYVRDLSTGACASHRAEQQWYLASMVKVPVAMAVLRGVERGQYTLDTSLTLRAADYVDGAGRTNSHPVGAPLSIRFLLEQMIIYSDNTASDMLIELVGVAEVNALVASLVPEGIRRITSLGEVRRQIYGQLVPGTDRLVGADLLSLYRQRSDAERLQFLSLLVDTPVERFRLPTLNAAYNAYYAGELNSGRVDAYGELLSQLAEGKALTPKYTAYLLTLMERIATGAQRLKAGLPPHVRLRTRPARSAAACATPASCRCPSSDRTAASSSSPAPAKNPRSTARNPS